MVVRGRARSCAVVRGRARSVVRGRARSCVVVRGRASITAVLPLRGQHCSGTKPRTDAQHIITPYTPPGVGWVNCFVCFKVSVSIRISY